MSVAAILCMHGLSSEFLIKSTEMILGAQENVYYINFSVGDSLEKLTNSYNDALKKLNFNKGVICMVDIWGGSPFNIACQVFNKFEYNYSIVSGVNIPMLIDFFMIREKKNNILEITESILSSGKVGINHLIKNKI